MAHVDMDGLVTGKDLAHEIDRLEGKIEVLEERFTRKMAQYHLATIIILGGLISALRFLAG